MLKFQLPKKGQDALKVLCIGAHSDDIEIGCGGTILRLLGENRRVEVTWVVLGSNGKRDREALAGARSFLAGAKTNSVIVKHYKDGFFPYEGRQLKLFFEGLKARISPDIIFTHCRHDLHQDHRLISELTWSTYRNHLILEYEIIKYDGDLGSPNVFVHLTEQMCARKIAFVLKAFRSQVGKDWFTADAFWSILRIRGIECKAPEKYAEGFYCRKVVL
ncbi:MAG: PIG-L deacetylase family protein [Thermodesulfobacteriota bacterium]